MNNSQKCYLTWDAYLKNRFGGKVFKIALDGGFSCPNIDGTRGVGGCTYCSYSQTRQTPEDLITQFQEGKAMLHRKWKEAVGYIPYFQANTNTYAPLPRLKEKFEAVLALPKVVGLSVATRADALPEDVCDYLKEIGERTYLTVELGLQTVHDETAVAINRGHTWDEFCLGYKKLADRGIPVCIHIINGLPGETPEMMRETARKIAILRPHSVKIHLLHVIAGTKLAEQYAKGEFSALTLEEYVEIVCDQLHILPPDTIIQRITGDGIKDSLIAPLWSLKKFVVMNEIDKQMRQRFSETL